jgi:hypothetical protein
VFLRKLPFLLFLVPAALFADEVYLKGAGTITGRIVEQTADVVKVDVGGGIMGVPMSNVERIVKGRSALDDYDDRARKLGPDDVAGWKKLGAWASQQGLSAQSQAAYKKVLAVAPDDTEANEAMGLVKLNGKWVTEEESYRARGFVMYDGEWMTPAEAKVAQDSYAANQARRDAERRASEAENAAAEAQARAKESEARAKKAEEDARRYADPVYWGGWGYGVTTWPSGNGNPHVYAPSQIPGRISR